jgi:hypothetical protein
MKKRNKINARPRIIQGIEVITILIKCLKLKCNLILYVNGKYYV